MKALRGRRIQLGVLAVAAALFGTVHSGHPASASPSAHPAATVVTLNLNGGYANRTRQACGIQHHYTYYHRGRRISFDGTVRPAPSGHFRVKVKVKKCVRGEFRTQFAVHVTGKAGTFEGSFRSPGAGFFFARAYYYAVQPAVRSDKQFFRVR